MQTNMPFDIVTLGEAMVEFNQTAPGEYRQGYGGDTANFVVAAARQGARTSYVTRLGDDCFGRLLLDLWQAEGVDCSGVQIDEAAPTAAYFVTHDAQGHQFHYLRAGSAASQMRADLLPLALIGNTRYLHVSGIGQAISASSCDATFAAIETARGAGATITYDPNLRLRLWPLQRARAVIAATIAQVDLFLPSLDEILTLSGAAGVPAALDWCARHGASQVVLKCGADGAWIWQRGAGAARLIAPLRVQPVDATGAGDCFDGALVARLAAGDELDAAVRYANVAAALSTTGVGAVAPIPDHATVLVHLAQSLL
jgi:2-dehydro-3-deoxygluconokinase